MRRVLLIGLTVVAPLGVAPASANDYDGTLANGGIASVAGTFIKCKVGGGALGCVVFKGGAPNQSAWAFTINDSIVQAGKVSGSSPSYTSPKQPKTDGAALSGGVKALRVKGGQNFGAAGTHVACSVLKVGGGQIGVACTLLGTKGAVAGSYGVVYTSHALQVRTVAGSKSKVLFARTF